MDIQNYHDIGFFFLLMLYFWFYNFYPFKGLHRFFAILNLIAWVRALNHLKVFESARVFISLLYEVIVDI